MPNHQEVKKMFKEVANRYDMVNSVVSFGKDARWRRRAAQAVAETKAKRIVDLATGSGALAFAIAKVYERRRLPYQITGYDFCDPLLAKANEALRKKKRPPLINFEIADALALPLKDNSIDAVTVAFGLRNFESRQCAYAEMLRVLRPGGHVFVLEFSQPHGLMKLLYHCYRPLIPVIAAGLGAKAANYHYLNKSVAAFPDAVALEKEMATAGFKNVKHKALTSGIVALHVGHK